MREFDLTQPDPVTDTANILAHTLRIANLIVSLWEADDEGRLETVLAAFAVYNLDSLPEDTLSKARIIELWPHALDLAITCAHMHDFDIPITTPEFIANTGE